ncbi:hypothetical protein [Wolbachia endosymbiont (group B) of Cyclophora punctaria]|uniref:hypothetical protein n=1 Tax=Wolbachia endosymbiont (group B) of Cyclophora punctaria TaxID=3066168 RepID=UPI003341E2E6
MRTKEFLNFLEKEKLKSIIYKRLKWKEDHVPKSSEELKALIYEFGKQRIIWWMPSVADCAEGKRFAKGQVVLALFFTGLSLCCLSKKYRLTSTLCLMALSCYIGGSFLFYKGYIRDYVNIYKGEIMPFSFYVGAEGCVHIEPNCEEAEECVEEDYIESIKGIVSSAEFSMHVHYLLKIKDEGYKDEDGIYQAGFNDYASQLRSSNRFKTKFEKSIVEKFLSYVEQKRELRRNNRGGVEEDINRLRYCDERKDERGIKEIYEKLFRYTKTLLWHVKPYKSQDVELGGFYTRVKRLSGDLSLGQALNIVYILHDDPDQVLRELKGLLVVYHPDKNKHEKAREIYEKVELIYKAVSAILKVHERHFGDTIFCKFKMFLGKKLKDIDENSVYEEIISTHKTLEMKQYVKKEEIIAEIRDQLLEQYRELIKLDDIVLEKRITYPNPKQYIGAEGKESQLKREYKNQEEGIQKISKLKEEIEEKIEGLSKKLRVAVEEILDVCSVIKERCNDEIGKQNSTLVGANKDAFNEYYSKKKIESFKKMLEKLDEEQKEMGTFLIRLKGKNFLNMVKNLNIKGLGISGFSAIKSALNSSYEAAKKREVLNTLKSGYETVRNVPYLATEYDYIGYYSNLHAEYLSAEKWVKNCEVESDGKGKLIFYGKVSKIQETNSSRDKVEFEVVDCKAKLEDLRSENNKLSKKFKTQQELEREAKENLLTTKDLKEKSIETRKEIEKLRSKNEISERRAEEAEIRAEEERRAKEEAEAKTKAIDLLYDEADDQEISRKRIKQDKEVQKFLECQYTFLVLNEGYITKFKNLCKEYRDLKREMKEPDFERLSRLANEFDKLSRSFIEGEKVGENVPESRDGDIDRLKLSIVTRVVQARDVAEKEKRKVEKEKTEAEEIVKQLQMQVPDTTFSSVSHEPVAGPSWWI